MRRILPVFVIFLLISSSKASAMSFTNLEGEDQEIQTGTPLIIEVFATWCSACKDQHPILTEVYSTLSDSVTLLSISSSEKDSIETIREFLLEYPSSWSYGLDPDKYFWKKYGVLGTPTFLSFSDKGEFLGCTIGLQQKDTLEGIFQSAIEGKVGEKCPTLDSGSKTPPELILLSLGLVVVIVLFRIRKKRKTGE